MHMEPLSARETETQSSPMVKSSASSDACPETRGLKPGWSSLSRAQVPLSCTFEVEPQTLPSKGTGASLEAEGLQMSGKSPSWTPGDSSFLFIPCFSARLPPNQPRGRAAELTNAVPVAALVAGRQVSAFIAKPYPAMRSLPQLAQGTHTRRVSVPVTVTPGDRDLAAGLGRQQEAEGKICLQVGRVNRGALLGKENRSL